MIDPFPRKRGRPPLSQFEKFQRQQQRAVVGQQEGIQIRENDQVFSKQKESIVQESEHSLATGQKQNISLLLQQLAQDNQEQQKQIDSIDCASNKEQRCYYKQIIPQLSLKYDQVKKELEKQLDYDYITNQTHSHSKLSDSSFITKLGKVIKFNLDKGSRKPLVQKQTESIHEKEGRSELGNNQNYLFYQLQYPFLSNPIQQLKQFKDTDNPVYSQKRKLKLKRKFWNIEQQISNVDKENTSRFQKFTQCQISFLKSIEENNRNQCQQMMETVQEVLNLVKQQQTEIYNLRQKLKSQQNPTCYQKNNSSQNQNYNNFNSENKNINNLKEPLVRNDLDIAQLEECENQNQDHLDLNADMDEDPNDSHLLSTKD